MGSIAQTLLMEANATKVYTTFDPAFKRSDITLSGGNLTAAVANNLVNGQTASIITTTSGKWYCEIYISTLGDFGVLGITAKGSATQWPGLALNDWGYSNGGNIYNNSGVVTTVASFTSGDTIGIALDMDGLTIKFYKNNVLQTTQTIAASAFGVGVGETAAAANATTYTANFGATALTYTPPSGYNAGLYV